MLETETLQALTDCVRDTEGINDAGLVLSEDLVTFRAQQGRELTDATEALVFVGGLVVEDHVDGVVGGGAEAGTP